MEAGSGNSGTFSPETAESLRFEEEIQSLMQLHANFDSSPVSGSSFTALLGLSPPPEISAGTLALPLVDCAPVFPSNAALVERAARFSAFAAAAEVKAEAEDYGDPPSIERRQRLTGKRKAAEEKSKVVDGIRVKGPVKKKSKNAEENTGGEKLPYVHVRARRGQATDSHSLAERARREKINARMKLLQELVPGCSKISGTALVLDETINHVQSLQRHVEFLSMKLAAVYPGVNFNGLGLDSFSTECGHLMAGSGRMEQLPWLDGMVNGMKLQQQIWVMDHHQEEQKQHKQQEWERDDTQQCHVFISNPSSTTSNFCYDSSTPNAVELHNQLKTEL